MGRNSLKNVMKLIDITNGTLGPEESFLQYLKSSIEKSNDSDYVPSKTIKPSSFNCIRNAYYQLIGLQPDSTKRPYNNAGICESGTDRHIRMQLNLEKMHDVLDVNCEYISVEDFVKRRELKDLEVVGKSGMETKLYNKKYNMSFMCDGIIRYEGKYYIFEFKTETSDKFYQRKGVDESHYVQAICYSLNFNLDDVLFLYENRNTLDLKCYIFHVTEEMKKDVISKIETVLKCAEEKVVPSKPEDVLKKSCTYCAYKNQCEVDTWL